MDQPLAGRTVVVTRASAQAGAFVSELEGYGAGVIVCPTIEITDPESYERLDEAIEHLYGYDWLIFSSINAVDFFLRRLAARSREVSELDEVKVCAIGEATAERLRQAHIHIDIVPVKFKAEGVFAALTRFVGGRERLHGLNLLLPRATAARDYLPRALEEAGAPVDVVPPYRTVLPENLDPRRLKALLPVTPTCIPSPTS